MKINKLDTNAIRRSRMPRILVIVVFAAMGILAVLDLSADLAQGTTFGHLIIESVVVLICLVVATAIGLALIRDAMEMRSANAGLIANLDQSRLAAESWRSEAESLLTGLGQSINVQFDAWKLTPVEKDIALFLLKGLSHKEVAYIREVSDATVRQQARSIYQKAGVVGRHGLAAFFLEDLALPIESSAPQDN
jgi:DNA-binding NarL/FixJ family response regulator